MSRGILKRNNRDTTNFNADASNTGFSFRIIHCVNQLSIYGSVTNWCEEFGLKPNERQITAEKFVTNENEQLLKQVKPQGVNSLVQAPRRRIATMSS